MEKDPGNEQVTEENLLKLIREQKRMNNEMLAELEQIKAASPISHDIQYIKVLLDSSSTHILQDLMSLSRQLPHQKKSL
ncbi:hypothetical protein J7E26_02550 [Bacillus sp. ISL-51]|uniref:hypothetical protein n=1 Tax=Bacteria TaxID=2 RepID=UPI001BE5E58F|nr:MULTISPECIES: hypothetical protein [Bacteria]MBT2572840.1 hypothetical protein [Bacillus sp. ISL-51]MBT2635435.1 hypothetical protein [Bacillus sp. ISL-26]MBT2713313.1 hypothetical protein [Pseudomonas sp. ISL-88]